MRKMVYLALCCLWVGILSGCGSKNDDVMVQPTPVPATSAVKIRVTDVSNNTGELFDVDVIGLLWSGLDEALRNRGMLWTPAFPEPPLTLEATITKYKKGSLLTRSLVPFAGNTVLVAQCELKDGTRVISSAESRETLSMGKGGMTFGAWRKIFGTVSEDLVRQVTGKL